MGRTLFIAAGGGGDPIGAWLVARTLGDAARPAILTWSWDRLIFDPVPGPRCPAEFAGLSPLGHCNYQVTPSTTVRPPSRSTLPRVAAELDADLFLIDPTRGAVGLHTQIAELVQALDAEAVCVVDVGGDIIARGDEPELLSPLADAIVLAAIQDLAVPTQVVVAGPGVDGELNENSVRDAVNLLGGNQIDRVSAMLAIEVAPIFEWHPSEATASSVPPHVEPAALFACEEPACRLR